MKILMPKSSRLIPRLADRKRIHKMLNSYPPEKFETYWDWFYFLHLDPVLRFIHWVGMVIGIYYYYKFAVNIFDETITNSAITLGIGFFCFYCFGVISHLIYDKGAAKSDPRFWHVTLGAVVYINVATMFFFYDRTLRRFVAKYPFVLKEWELEEKTIPQAIAQVIGFK